MIYYKDYDYSQILDRKDLTYSPYIAALDMQFSHHKPYLWSFMLDSTGSASQDPIAYGRSYEELIDFLQRLKKHLNLHRTNDTDKHLMIVMIDDLFTFFAATKKDLPYSCEPFVAKSASDILLATLLDVYELHSYKAYYETDVEKDMLLNYGIVTLDIDRDALSDGCELTEEELDNSANKVYYMCCSMREEIDLKYQGSVGKLVLTKTSRVNSLFGAEMRRESNRNKCNLRAQIMKLNPITTEYGREFLIPMMYKAFIGGCVFFEDGIPNLEFDNVWSIDLSSAYAARMVLSRYPVGKFEEMQQPSSFKDLFKAPYNRFAMLITFEVEDVELRPGGLAFIPAQFRAHYIDINNPDEIADQIERASSTRIRSARRLRMTLTDIDFRLFWQNYKFKRIRLENIVGSKYGFLPDYVQRVIVQLYSTKADAKNKKEALRRAGALSADTESEYNRIKSELARLYGIFTKRPIVKRYAFDTEKKEPKIIDKYYISESSKYSAVLYQWGVWTTALVRKEIAELRGRLMSAPSARQVKVLSGDTDNINYQGDATDIIADYNADVKSQIERRAAQIGIEPELLQDLGSLSVTKYKKYKLTGLKQYCYIRETESGDVFEYKVGGMSQKCRYFDEEFNTPEQRFSHFGLGLVIPRKYEPRIIKMPVSERLVEEWTDRDGNRCRSECEAYIKTIIDKFTIAPLVTHSGLKPDGSLPTLGELEELADKIQNPVYNPLNYIKDKYIRR